MAGKGVTIVIQGDGESAKRALEMVEAKLRETADEGKRDAATLAEAMNTVRNSLASVGIAIGLREVIGVVKQLVGASVDLGVEVSKMAKETGIAAQDLSVLKYASEITGVSFEALSKGSLKLSKSMLDAEEGKKQAINSFSRLGISQDDVRAKSNDLYGMLGVIADRFAKIPDGPNKAAAAMGLFGKAGAQLIPFLDQGSAGIEELRGQAQALGVVLDEAGVEKMMALHQAAVQLKGSVEGAGIGITQGLEPALLEVAASLRGAGGEANGFVAIGETLGYVVKGLATLWDLLTVAVHQTIDVLYGAIMVSIDAAKVMKSILTMDNAAAFRSATDDMASHWKATLSTMSDDGALFKRQMGTLWNSPDPVVKKPARTGGTPDSITPGDQTEKSTDAVARAAAELAQAKVEAEAAVWRSFDASALEANEAGHKLMLISDEEYYAEKLRLQEDELDVQAGVLTSRLGILQQLEQKQKTDSTLKRDETGKSAEELKTAKEMVQLNAQLADLGERRNQLNTKDGAEASERADQVKLATLKMAAELEEQSNTTITARLALLRLENSLELEKISQTSGTDSPEYRQAVALDKVKEAKLQIADVDRQIRESEADNKRAVDELNDAAAKDPRLKVAVAREINELNKAEAEQLRTLVAQYDALAKTIGGPALQTAKDLHAELDKLNTPDKKQDAQFAKTLADGVTSMAERMASAAASGKDSFHKMAQEIEHDLLELAMKLAAEKWLTPFLMGIGGGGSAPGTPDADSDLMQSLLGNAHANGGDMDSPGLVGEKGPELFFPKGPGTVIPNSMLSRAAAGGAGQAPNVTMKVTNASSQPVTARQTGMSFDSESKEFIIHTILEDQANGGMLAQAAQHG